MIRSELFGEHTTLLRHAVDHRHRVHRTVADVNDHIDAFHLCRELRDGGEALRIDNRAGDTDTVIHPLKSERHLFVLRQVRRKLRLIFRSIVFAACLCAVFFFPDEFDVLQGWNFFHRFSPLHILWIVWIFDMLWQLIPVKNKLPLGSQKHFLMRFKPIKDAINYKALRKYIIDTTKSAYKVMIIWIALTLTLAFLRLNDVLNDTHLFMISCAFYVCDLICVLVWCPFRLIMRNRCCTTCRIFNWDHLSYQNTPS